MERQEAGSEPWDLFGLPQDEAVWEMEETKQEILFLGWGKRRTRMDTHGAEKVAQWRDYWLLIL